MSDMHVCALRVCNTSCVHVQVHNSLRGRQKSNTFLRCQVPAPIWRLQAPSDSTDDYVSDNETFVQNLKI